MRCGFGKQQGAVAWAVLLLIVFGYGLIRFASGYASSEAATTTTDTSYLVNIIQLSAKAGELYYMGSCMLGDVDVPALKGKVTSEVLRYQQDGDIQMNIDVINGVDVLKVTVQLQEISSAIEDAVTFIGGEVAGTSVIYKLALNRLNMYRKTACRPQI